MPHSSEQPPLALGIDFGTSGVRAAVVAPHRQVVYQGKCAYPQAATQGAAWQAALTQVITEVPPSLRQQVSRIALDGTSATVLLCDEAGHPLTEPLLYNDDRGRGGVSHLQTLAPAGSPVLSATSSLVKLLWWRERLPPDQWAQARFLMHQADWLGFLLHGQPGISDYHNALKLGYDVGRLQYPDWLLNLGLTPLLPQVKPPGEPIAPLQPAVAEQYGFPASCWVYAGTTDSIAAFLASGAQTPGEAVTSLGSTLVIKLLSQTRVDDSRYGIYSHRLGDLWLVGGASNTGGAVLSQFFSDDQLRRLSQQINPDQPSGLDYYPLLKPGERFPLNDPTLMPRLTPRPAAEAQFLQGMLEGIARIEQQGYALLESLGATPVTQIYTAGGGAQNSAWTAIRQRYLQKPVKTAHATEAAVGAAWLAAQNETGSAVEADPNAKAVQPN